MSMTIRPSSSHRPACLAASPAGSAVKTTSASPTSDPITIDSGALCRCGCAARSGSPWWDRATAATSRAAGEPHAEVNALRKAGAAARGGTIYTNLEPCAHTGRTPPCVSAIKEAGVARVVAAMRDPDPRTNGKGFRGLRDAGIEVTVGVLADEAARLNAGFISRLTRGRPFVLIKLAATIDGRV